MNEELIMMLDEEIKSELKELSQYHAGSDEYNELVEGLTKLYKLRIEDSKEAMEYNKELDDDEFRKDRAEKDDEFRKERAEKDDEFRQAQAKKDDEFRKAQAEKEEQFRKKQIAEQRIDRFVRIGIAAAELTVPIIFYNVWMKRGFKFEETGTFTSTTFKDLIRLFRPTKR